MALTSVLVLFTKVNSTDNVHILVVDGVPFEMLFVKLQHCADVVVDLVDSLVLDLFITFRACEFSRQFTLVPTVLDVMDRTMGGVLGGIFVICDECLLGGFFA